MLTMSPLGSEQASKSGGGTQVLTVYFSGTKHKIGDPVWNAAVLCAGTYDSQGEADEGISHHVMGFDGCGIEHGLRGVLFGAGQEQQCGDVIQRVKALSRSGGKLILNVYGYSRGGIFALMLAKALRDMPPAQLEINLLLVDPVPGNARITSRLDVFGVSRAAQAMDLSNCPNLSRVLCLYPSDASPDELLHAPIFPDYPAGCAVDEEVIPGSHLSVQAYDKREARLAFSRSVLFLKECGTVFRNRVDIQDRPFNIDMDERRLTRHLKKMYQSYAAFDDREKRNTQRYGHTGRRDIHIASGEDGMYLNVHHQRLAGEPANAATCILKIEKSLVFPAVLLKALAWLMVGAVTATVLYITGGLALLPIVSGWQAPLGILTLTPVLSLLFFGLFQGVIKPVSGLLRRRSAPASEDSAKQPECVVRGSYGALLDRGLLNDRSAPEVKPQPDCVVPIDPPGISGFTSRLQNDDAIHPHFPGMTGP